MSGPIQPTYAEDLRTNILANGPTMWRKAMRVVTFESELGADHRTKSEAAYAKARGILMKIYPETIRTEEPVLDSLVVSVSIFLEVYVNQHQYRLSAAPSQVMWDLAKYLHGLNIADSPNRWPERLIVQGWRPVIDPKFLVYRMDLSSTLNEEAS